MMIVKKFLALADGPLDKPAPRPFPSADVLDKYGFLEPTELGPNNAERYFYERCLWLDKLDRDEDPGEETYFSYRQCVLQNIPDFTQLSEFTSQFIQAIKDGESALELPRHILDRMQKVTKFDNERVFYFMHQMIELTAGRIFSSLIRIFDEMNSALKAPESVVTGLDQMLGAFEDINCIMSVFSQYIPPSDFKIYRHALKPASGAQSPLRFLDRLMYGCITFPKSIIKNEGFLEDIDERLHDTFHHMFESIPTPTSKMTGRSFPTAETFMKELDRDYSGMRFDHALRELAPFVEFRLHIAKLFKERAIFKLWHAQIVNHQLLRPSKEKEASEHAQAKAVPVRGTGGSHMATFLRDGFFTDYCAYLDCVSERDRDLVLLG